MSTIEASTEVVQDPSARSAAAQNSAVPLGWKPTPSEPVPVVRCVQIKKDGNRCGRWSRRGATKCIKHLDNGGALKNVEEHRLAVIEAAKLRLLDDTDLAIDTLEALMEPGSGEGIRLKSATEVLDRAGIRAGFELDVDLEVHTSPVDELRSRILDLKKGAIAAQRMRDGSYDTDDDIVEGEIVSDQPTLFDLLEPDHEESDE